ncbi:hypothetical protein B0H14DRAFT_2638187 [Mycena olivaceomarginata]|nr:hypothetical protein B0H14DRAFT_2638187 [Mycena olivaceomarginata]
MPEPDSEDKLIHRHYALLTNRDGGLHPYMVCALYESEQARLGVDEALCGGPCAPDDAEELAIASADVDKNTATFRNLEAGSNLLYMHWLSKTTLILEAITTFSVQMFFCRRLWVRVPDLL